MTEQIRNRILTTLCRLGRYEGVLEEDIGKSSEGLRSTATPSEEIKTFASFYSEVEPYFLIVSQKMDNPGINSYLAVVSYSDEKNKEVADRFREETGIVLESESEAHRRIISRLEQLFPEFERNPGKAISILEAREK